MKKRLNETEYQQIKKILSASNITDEKGIQLKLKGMLASAKRYSIIGFILTALLIVLLPRFSVFIVLIFCLFLAWLWSSTISSQQYFKRYLREINTNNTNE